MSFTSSFPTSIAVLSVAVYVPAGYYIVSTKRFVGDAQLQISSISSYSSALDTTAQTDLSKARSLIPQANATEQETRRPASLSSPLLTLSVGLIATPLSDVDMDVRRIHIKVPSTALGNVYVGDASQQNLVLQPGDRVVLEVRNPRNVYVRADVATSIYVLYEQ